MIWFLCACYHNTAKKIAFKHSKNKAISNPISYLIIVCVGGRSLFRFTPIIMIDQGKKLLNAIYKVFLFTYIFIKCK